MGQISGANRTANFRGVKSAFDSGAYTEALRQLQSNPSDDATYYYNLGTTFLKLGKAGPAVAYLEKANRLEPHDASIQQNLQISRNTLGHLMGTQKLDPASTWSENVADNLRLDEIRGAFGLVGFVIALFWIRSYLKSRRIRQTLMKPAGIMGIGALAITAGLYSIEVAGMNPAAVCLNRQTIRSGPGDQYIELSQCESGMKVRLLGPTAEAQNALTATPVSDSAVPSSTIPSSVPSALSLAASATAPSTTPSVGAALNPAPQLWRQIRYSADGIGWVRSSGLLLL